MEKQVLTFTQERVTKNTIRYAEQTEGDPLVGTIYVQKSALGQPPPQSITVTIEAANV